MMSETKRCTKCGEEKYLSEFNKHSISKDGVRPDCRECQKIRANRYSALNKFKRKQGSKNYYQRTKEKSHEKSRKWAKANPERYREIQRLAKRRQLANPKARLEANVRSEVRVCLLNGTKRGRRTFELLGYSVSELHRHLESKFETGMSWDNYGPKWEVDHVIPLSAFNYNSPDQIDFKRAWALSNLQPLWRSQNRSKHAKLTKPFQPSLAL